MLERPAIEDGLLWFADQWYALSESQLQLMALLTTRFGEVIHNAELEALCAVAGTSAHPEALRAAMGRLTRRLRGTGLALRRVRNQGYLLTSAATG